MGGPAAPVRRPRLSLRNNGMSLGTGARGWHRLLLLLLPLRRGDSAVCVDGGATDGRGAPLEARASRGLPIVLGGRVVAASDRGPGRGIHRVLAALCEQLSLRHGH